MCVVPAAPILTPNTSAAPAHASLQCAPTFKPMILKEKNRSQSSSQPDVDNEVP